jgi:hypothetical protein
VELCVLSTHSFGKEHRPFTPKRVSAPLNGLMHRMTNGERAEECPLCSEAVETPEHFLLVCSSNEKERARFRKRLKKACTCEDRPSCFEFARRLKAEGLQTFLLGGPVDGRVIEPEVDAKSFLLVSEMWDKRKASLTKAAEETTQVSDEASSDQLNSDQPDLQSLFARQSQGVAKRRPMVDKRGRRRGMDDDSDDSVCSWSSTPSEPEPASSSDLAPSSSASEGEGSVRGYRPPSYVINQLSIVQNPTRRPYSIVTRSRSSTGLEAHVDIDTPPN